MTRFRPLILALGAAVLLAVPAFPAPARAQAPAEAARNAFDQDRRAILAMAGDYKVRFDFREVLPMQADYTPLPQKLSGGHEVVRVIADTGRFISLQHLLVVDMGDGKPVVIKHWRQDWTYEPDQVLTYAGKDRWTLTPVAAAERRGAWSQTVWQTDDSPRYGGVGRWLHANGEDRWTSGPTWRPLARRDAIRNPPYDRYDAINRHVLTPGGWAHLQDNAKIGMKGGQPAIIVHEDGLNTYAKFDGFPVAAADAYWARTKDYWAGVRAAWDRAAADGVIEVEEEAQNGSVTGPRLMGLADELAEGAITAEAAAAGAREEFAAKVR